DYESLRIGGMIFAVILFFMGIFLIVGECQTLYCSQKVFYFRIVLAIKCTEYFL
uniref:FXYD domain-containing ion transport regulator n=1 Tax=Cyprinus carpio TaxID=7962 RepID=A0A8C2CDC5_CYPCA